MWIDSKEGKEFVKQISKLIVIEVAPEEMDLFDELVSDYSNNPKSPTSTKTKDDPLSFGVNEIIVAVTTATVAMVTATLNYITETSLGAIKEEGAKVIIERIKATFDPNKKSREIPPLSKEQMRMVNRIATKQAIDFGISPNKARKMARALIGTLSLK